MNNFILTIDEIKTIKRIKNCIIPLAIKYYCFKHLPAIELINSRITEILLKRSQITEEFFKETNSKFMEFQNEVQINKLDEAARNYYLGLDNVFTIFKKHYSPQKLN